MIQSKTAQNEASSFRMEEQDQANVILSELKRTAREYTTAALEANHLQVREQFTTLLNQTLKHQAELYEAIRSLNAYGSVPTATAQEIQSESQKQTKSAAKLRALVHQFTSASSASVSGGSSAQGASNFVHAGSVTVDEADRQDSLTNTEGPLAQGQSFAQAQGSASQKEKSLSSAPTGTEVPAFSASRVLEAEANRLTGQPDADMALSHQGHGEHKKPQPGAVLTQQLYPNAVYQPHSSQGAPATSGQAPPYQSQSPYIGSGQGYPASDITQRGITRPGQPAGSAFQGPSYPGTGHASPVYIPYGGIGGGSGGMQPLPPHGSPGGSGCMP
ncbi:spore coat protein [Paenibacillus larvae]